MPGFDGTGPWGGGPITGGGRGFCSTRSAVRGGGQGFGRGMGRGFGRGQGRGFGPGRGFGWRAWGPPAYYDAPYGAPASAGNPYAPPMNRDQEIDFLQNQAQAIKEELEDIEARISNIQQKESS